MKLPTVQYHLNVPVLPHNQGDFYSSKKKKKSNNDKMTNGGS